MIWLVKAMLGAALIGDALLWVYAMAHMTAATARAPRRTPEREVVDALGVTKLSRREYKRIASTMMAYKKSRRW